MTTEIASSWFVYSQDGDPLGQVHRRLEEAFPKTGARFTVGAEARRVEIVEFTELRQSCGLRRFRVVVRPID